jgi:hypothetical protein
LVVEYPSFEQVVRSLVECLLQGLEQRGLEQQGLEQQGLVLG